jgi:NAD(P)-dependent dehydrogenase (short-subunit alcohol dehydrogenase family)
VAVIVITGSTRGIGLGLARAFVGRGHNVVVSSRSASAVDRTVIALASDRPGRVAGFACDVTESAQVAALWDHATAAFGTIDIWINNAGTSGPRRNVVDLGDADAAQWARTKRFYNILGDRVETVAPFIADRVLAASQPGTAIRWLTRRHAVGRFLTARATGRKVMPD